MASEILAPKRIDARNHLNISLGSPAERRQVLDYLSTRPEEKNTLEGIILVYPRRKAGYVRGPCRCPD